MDISKNSLVDQVYSILRHDIITLKYPLGSRFNVNEIKDSLQVSSTPIREAINRLQQEGLMTYENNIGARIIGLSKHDVDEINELALTLHHKAIFLSVKRGDLDDMVNELKRHVAEYNKAKNEEDEVLAIYDFIGTYYHNCKNNRIDKSMKGIQGQQLLLRWIYAKTQTQRRADSETLDKMLSATIAKDPIAVCEALDAFTSKCVPFVLDYIKNYQE